MVVIGLVLSRCSYAVSRLGSRAPHLADGQKNRPAARKALNPRRVGLPLPKPPQRRLTRCVNVNAAKNRNEIRDETRNFHGPQKFAAVLQLAGECALSADQGSISNGATWRRVASAL